MGKQLLSKFVKKWAHVRCGHVVGEEGGTRRSPAQKFADPVFGHFEVEL